MSLTTRLWLAKLGLLLSISVPMRAAATTAPSSVPEWELIEADMRADGCFQGAIGTAVDALDSDDSFCRSRAARVVGLRGDQDAREKLVRVLEDETQFVRVSAAIALARLGEPKFLKSVRELMDHAETVVERVALAGRLAEVGDASGYRYVEEACTSESAVLRKDCIGSLRQFTRVAKDDAQSRTSVLVLFLRLAEDQDSEVRKTAVLAFPSFALSVPFAEEDLARITEVQYRTRDPEVEHALGLLLDNLRREREKLSSERSRGGRNVSAIGVPQAQRWISAR